MTRAFRSGAATRVLAIGVSLLVLVSTGLAQSVGDGGVAPEVVPEGPVPSDGPEVSVDRGEGSVFDPEGPEGDSGPATTGKRAHREMGGSHGWASEIPSALPGAESEFAYDPVDLGFEDVVLASTSSTMDPIPTMVLGGGGGGSGGNKLGNAPEALTKVLEMFLAKGKDIPPNFPVPYVVYTKADGVEKTTDVLTKMPIMLNVDDSALTGHGNGKDIRVKTTLSTNPLALTTRVERMGDTHPTSLEVLVTFPAYFFTGEAADPDGKPYWSFGYATQPGFEVPEDLTMTMAVDQSVGSDHVFDFDWSSPVPIPKLGFTFGVFQVQAGDLTNPIFPAFADFVVSSPPFAALTFDTMETATTTSKCMVWSAPAPFYLEFDFEEIEEIVGVDYGYPMTVTVDQVPQSFSICTVEDRAANTYAIDYVANANVDLVEVTTQIVASGLPTVTIDLAIEDMPDEFHLLMGDGFMNVDVTSNVGLVRLDAVADLGLGAVPNMAEARLRISDIPDFAATWFEGPAGNGFALDAPSCVGSIEFAFSYGSLLFPAVHAGDPDAHYLFAFSDPAVTAIALRLLELRHIGFEQDNDDQSNTVSLSLCGNHDLHVIADTAIGSSLTPARDVDLTVFVSSTPTEMTVTWTVPFTLGITTNDAIAVITADLSVVSPGPPAQDLTADVDILDIPADMAWLIDPAGSIAFTADGSIGTVLVRATDPNGLPGTATLFDGQPLRLFRTFAHDVPSFSADWTVDEVTPETSVAFQTGLGTELGDLTFGVSTSETLFVTVPGPEENRGMVYHDDSLNLGHGFVMEGSIWIHVEDIRRAEMSFGGAPSTIDVGFGTAVAHELKARVLLDGTSGLNPAAPDRFEATVLTTPLPTSMDLTVTPETGFSYDASAELALVTVDAMIGEPAGTPTTIHLEIEGVPSMADGSWTLGDPGSVTLIMNDRLDRIEVVVEDSDGLFGTDFVRMEARIADIPESVEANWDAAGRTFSLDFLDATYDEGLGELYFLATEATPGITTAYVNSLGTPAACMTDYGEFTVAIDEDYWPTNVPGRLDSLYCRKPTLDTAADDYALFRTGDDGAEDFRVYSLRVREIGLIDLDLNEVVGSVDLEFSRNVALARQFYLVSDDFDDDELTIVEVTNLPDGLPTNSIHVEWDRTSAPGRAEGHYAYALTEVISFIDVYLGPHAFTSLTSDFTKIVLVDVPASVSLDFDFGDRDGVADFVASNPWEVGVLSQDDETRYVGWLQMQSLHFDYSFALPGEEACGFGGYDLEWCYRVFRLDTSLDAIGTVADGILGIYNHEDQGDLQNLDSGEGPRAGGEYIPQWAFILDDFDVFEVHVLWDVGIGINILDPPDFVVSLLPVVALIADLNLVVDFFWNDDFHDSVGGLPFPWPLLPPCIVVDASVTVNTVLDYVDQKPIHIWPLGDSPIDPDFSAPPTYDFPDLCWELSITLDIDIPGFHRFPDHPGALFP